MKIIIIIKYSLTLMKLTLNKFRSDLIPTPNTVMLVPEPN